MHHQFYSHTRVHQAQWPLILPKPDHHCIFMQHKIKQFRTSTKKKTNHNVMLFSLLEILIHQPHSHICLHQPLLQLYHIRLCIIRLFSQETLQNWVSLPKQLLLKSINTATTKFSSSITVTPAPTHVHIVSGHIISKTNIIKSGAGLVYK